MISHRLDWALHGLGKSIKPRDLTYVHTSVAIMVLRRRSLLTKTIPFLLVGLAVYVIYLIFFVGLGDMVSMIGRVNLPMYLTAIAATIAEMAFFALAWDYFLKPLSTAFSFKKAFIYSWVGNFVDLLVPAESISGEISRIYFATRDGVNTGKAAASVVSQRIMGMFIIIGALTTGALQMLALHVAFPTIVQSVMFLVAASTAVFLSIIIILCFKQGWTRTVISKLIGLAEFVGRGKWNLAEWRKNAEETTEAFYESLRSFRANSTSLVPPVAFSIFSFLFSVLVFYVVFAALGYFLDWAVLIVTYSLVLALKSIPIGVPAEVGLTEIAMTTLLGAFGVPLLLSGAATVLIRIVTVWFKFAVGLVAVQWVGLKTVLETETFQK